MTTQPMLSNEQIEEIVYIVLNHGRVKNAVVEIREYLATLIPPTAPSGDREAVLIAAVRKWATIEPSRTTVRDIGLEVALENYEATI